MKTNDLSELISSRICHDLISPVGAVNNGVELVTAMQGTTPELDLIGQSAKSAQAKLEFYRIAFGAGGSGLVGSPQVSRIARDMFSNGRISVEFPNDRGERPRHLVKLLYLLLLCVETTLPRGGTIRCTPGATGWLIEVDGTQINTDQTNWAHFSTGQRFAGPTPSNIQFALAQTCAADSNKSIKHELSETHLKVSF